MGKNLSDFIDDHKWIFMIASVLFAFVYNKDKLKSIRHLVGNTLTLSSIIIALLGVFLSFLSIIKKGSFLQSYKRSTKIKKRLMNASGDDSKNQRLDYYGHIVKLIRNGMNCSVIFMILNIILGFIPKRLMNNVLKRGLIYFCMKIGVSSLWMYLLLMMIWSIYYITRMILQIVEIDHFYD